MGTFKHVSDVTTARVFDITNVKNVVIGVVTATSMRLERQLSQARYLLARLLRRLAAGPWAMAKCHAEPAATATMWAHQPSWSAGAHLCRLGRLSRPRSAATRSRS